MKTSIAVSPDLFIMFGTGMMEQCSIPDPEQVCHYNLWHDMQFVPATVPTVICDKEAP